MKLQRTWVMLVSLLLIAAAPASARKWTNDTGKFSVEAELVEAKDGSVTLKKQNGKVITVPLSKLSKADRDFLASIVRAKKKPEAKTRKLSSIAALLHNFPKDGSWSEYAVTINARDGDEHLSMKAFLRIAMLSAGKRRGQPAHWLEFTFRETQRKNPVRYVLKLLIKDSRTKPGRHWLGTTAPDGWEKLGDKEVERFDEERLKKRLQMKNAAFLILLTPLEEFTELPPVEVETKAGKFKCAGLQGTKKEDRGSISFSSRVNDSVPFGTTRFQIEIEVDDNQLFDVKFELIATGNDGKSALPQSN